MVSGPVADYINDTLSGFKTYIDYKSGLISQNEFIQGLQDRAEEIDSIFGDSFYRNLVSRYPSDFHDNANRIAADLYRIGFFKKEIDITPFSSFHSRILREYNHGSNTTFIHPDEAQLAYMVSIARKPQRLVAVGAYYGYWAVWSLPGVAEGNGRAILIDPNPDVCRLAEENFRKLNFTGITTILNKRAEEIFPMLEPGVDIFLLDAAGPSTHSDPAYHGKGIYGFLISDIYDKLSPGGLLLVHNDKPHETVHEPLKRFHDFCRRNFSKMHVATTPEGFGIYMK